MNDELVLKIRHLDQERRIDPVPGDLSATVQLWLTQARSHLDAAPVLLQIGNRSLALEAIHQCCRVSLVAHLYAAGWRAVGQNNHALVVDYGRVAPAEYFTPEEFEGLDPRDARKLGLGSVQRGAVDVGQREVHALCGEGASDPKADASRSPGDRETAENGSQSTLRIRDGP